MKHTSKVWIGWGIGGMLFCGIACKLYVKLQALKPKKLNCSFISNTAYSYDRDSYLKPMPFDWPKPLSQSTDGLWVYSLFHPPCFAYDREARVVSAYPIAFRALDSQTLGLKLLKLEQQLYPLIFEGYYEKAVASEYTFLLYDQQRKAAFKLSLEHQNEHPFSILAFYEKSWDSSTQNFSEAVLRVFDERYGKVFDLKLQEVLPIDSFDIALLAEDTRLHFRQIGDACRLAKTSLCLRAIYPEYKTILLEQKHEHDADSDYFYLSLCNL